MFFCTIVVESLDSILRERVCISLFDIHYASSLFSSMKPRCVHLPRCVPASSSTCLLPSGLSYLPLVWSASWTVYLLACSLSQDIGPGSLLYSIVKGAFRPAIQNPSYIPTPPVSPACLPAHLRVCPTPSLPTCSPVCLPACPPACSRAQYCGAGRKRHYDPFPFRFLVA